MLLARAWLCLSSQGSQRLVPGLHLEGEGELSVASQTCCTRPNPRPSLEE